MPYLTQDDKDKFTANSDDNGVTEYLSKLPLSSFAGHLNYLNFKIVRRWIAVNGKKYFAFATIIGTLVCCVLEIYRRLVASYEDEKIQKNGDVT